jgi:hypothetical protein
MAATRNYNGGRRDRATWTTLAAVTGALNVCINVIAWDQVRRAARGRPSAIMHAQLRSRWSCRWSCRPMLASHFLSRPPPCRIGADHRRRDIARERERLRLGRNINKSESSRLRPEQPAAAHAEVAARYGLP